MSVRFPALGERFLERYEVVEVLGSGGMSRVYGAVQTGLDRKVAIKVLAPVGLDSMSDTDFERLCRRFEREAKIVSKLRSPHTMVMYDFGRHDPLLYMILEWIEGRTLHDVVREEGAVSEDRVVRIIRQALASLAEAHAIGILHRDIKPQNIMVFEHLDNADYVKVLDFGIAKIADAEKKETQLTGEQSIVGTPSYMSPEQILARELNPSSDIYSLGLVAYELLFGVVAVEAESNFSTMAHHLSPNPIELPANSHISAGMHAVLSKMIAKDPAERYQTSMEVMQDLAELEGGTFPVTSPGPDRLRTGAHGAGATPQGDASGERSPADTQRLFLTAVVMLVLVGVALSAVVWLLTRMMEPDEEDTIAAAEPAALVAETEPAGDEPPGETAVEKEPEEVGELVGQDAVDEENPRPLDDEPADEESTEKPAAAATAKKEPTRKPQPKPPKSSAKPSVEKAEEPAKNEVAAAEEPDPAPLPEPKKFEPPPTVTASTAKKTAEEEEKKKEEAKAKPKPKPKVETKPKPKKEPGVYSF